ncbi:hypothetical protein [Hyphomonas sp.]|uniref:hypothetical protein n=1 Tax=Hyphomonas sp. TaxID=87 RepID=UPI00391D4A56
MTAISLSVRQPWAWALIHGGKVVENRGRVPAGSWRLVGRRVFIHAAKGMTRAEYEDACRFMQSIGVDCPRPDQLPRGGVIGTMRLAAIISDVESPVGTVVLAGEEGADDIGHSSWFFGPYGLVMEAPLAIVPMPGPGQLGWFDFREGGAFDAPKPWMRNWEAV